MILVFQKTMALVMTFVVLFSTMPFTINMSFCGNTLVDITIFHKVANCSMEVEEPLNFDRYDRKKNCCSDKQIIVDGQGELQQTISNHTFEQQHFDTPYIYTYINLVKGIKESIISEHPPPLIVKKIYKLHEAYII